MAIKLLRHVMLPSVLSALCRLLPEILSRFRRDWGERESRKVLGLSELWPDPRVPDDARLRTQPPEILLQELTAWLAQTYPELNGVSWNFYDETRTSQVNAILREYEPEWARRSGEPEPLWRFRQQKLREDFLEGRATFFYSRRTIFLNEEVRADLRGTLWNRAQGARTVAHEAWHALRQDQQRFGPFEEGSADLFALIAVRTLCGADVRPTLRYPKLARAVDRLTRTFARQAGQTQEQVLLESRRAAHQASWLKGRLVATGASVAVIDTVMTLPQNTLSGHSAWYALVENLLEEVAVC